MDFVFTVDVFCHVLSSKLCNFKGHQGNDKTQVCKCLGNRRRQCD